MKRAWILALLGLMGSGAAEAGAVRYEVEGKPFEGYYLAGADKQAPLVVLVHDWDGLNGYEIKRAEMLVALGYSVFAVDLFGAGVRPSTVEDKKRLTGAGPYTHPTLPTNLLGYSAGVPGAQ
ncbi:dienelactone hydrolase family protein, partial [Aeromonas caviae]|uniref:dienelactone hydrolase family protein n=1 Tax=Aeromonas caviae TaxID=648 RepID=UPI0025B6F458